MEDVLLDGRFGINIIIEDLNNKLRLPTPRLTHYNTFRIINTTPKCIIIHFGFHYILNEFGHFHHGETN
jgi:hypothetical protein